MPVIAPPAITPIPDFPALSDRTTYNAKAFAWANAIDNVTAPEIAAVATNVFNNATEAATSATTATTKAAEAVTSANTAYANAVITNADRAVVAADKAIVQGIAATAGVASVNGVTGAVVLKTVGGVTLSGAGDIPVAGAGGAISSTSAVNITLTAASVRLQAINMTATDRSVVLPNATTLGLGGALFVVKNTGDIPFAVRDTSGTVIAGVEPGQVASLYLITNATSAGTWAIGDDSIAAPMSGLYPDVALVVNSAASNTPQVCPLTATTALLVYVVGATFEARVLTWASGVVSAGAALSVAVFTNSVFATAALTATQAVILFNNQSSPNVQAHTLNISGTTVTAGATLTIQAGTTTTDVAIEFANSTQAVCIFRNGSGFLAICSLNVSGTTLSAGTVLVVNAVLSDRLHIKQITSTTFLALLYDGVNSRCANYVLTVTGTTMNAGTVLNHAATGYQPLSLCVLSTTLAVLLVRNGDGTMSVVTITIATTTTTIGQIVVTGRLVQSALIAKLNSNTALVVFTSNTAGRFMYTLKQASNIVSFGPITGLLSYSTSSAGLACLTTNRLALFAYAGASSFITVDPINIAL